MSIDEWSHKNIAAANGNIGETENEKCRGRGD